MTVQVYSLVADFPNQAVASEELDRDIVTAGLAKPLHTGTGGDVVTITFAIALSAPEVITLDGVVAIHQGVSQGPTDAQLDFSDAYKAVHMVNYRTYSYNSDDLVSQVKYFADSGKTEELWRKDMVYDSDCKLTTLTLTHTPSSDTFQKTFTYTSDDELDEISRT